MGQNEQEYRLCRDKNESRRYDSGFIEDNLKFTEGRLQLKRTRIEEKSQGKLRLAILWCNCCFSLSICSARSLLFHFSVTHYLRLRWQSVYTSDFFLCFPLPFNNITSGAMGLVVSQSKSLLSMLKV